MYKLISATPSPFARKVRIALIEKGIMFELITEVPWDRTTTTPLHNPLEKLPVLVLDDGQSIYDSAYILEYLEMMHPSPALAPKNPSERLAARKLEVLCDGICDAVVLSFFERRRQPECQSVDWQARQRRKIEGGVREMAKLVGSRNWAVGEQFGLGDIAVGTALGYLSVRFSDFNWQSQYPELAKFANRMEQRTSFAATRPVPQHISDAVV